MESETQLFSGHNCFETQFLLQRKGKGKKRRGIIRVLGVTRNVICPTMNVIHKTPHPPYKFPLRQSTRDRCGEDVNFLIRHT